MKTPHGNMENAHWTGFAASIPGGGHIRHGIPCQDASAVMTSPRPAVIVCDGRGSASLSHFGAQGAVTAFRSQMSILEPFLANILDGEEEKQEQWIKFCQIMYRTFMQVKYDLAEKHNEGEKEFDCTVAFAIAGEKRIGCFQVGDGSIVVRQNNVCTAVFPPEKGEFANQTHFLRPGGEEEMKFQHTLLDAKVNSGIAVTSDGPEHLMFRLSDMTPGKIFDMLLDDLRKEELCKQDLMDYLTRREWANDPRGSDDRSLALLARLGDKPVIAPEPADTTAELEVKTEPEVAPETKTAPVSKPEAKMKAQEEVPIETAESKKKAIPYRILAIVSSLTIGLLMETACLVKQHQTISRLREKILYLNQQLARKKALPENVQQKTSLPDFGDSTKAAKYMGMTARNIARIGVRRDEPNAIMFSREMTSNLFTEKYDKETKQDAPKDFNKKGWYRFSKAAVTSVFAFISKDIDLLGGLDPTQFNQLNTALQRLRDLSNRFLYALETLKDIFGNTITQKVNILQGITGQSLGQMGISQVGSLSTNLTNRTLLGAYDNNGESGLLATSKVLFKLIKQKKDLTPFNKISFPIQSMAAIDMTAGGRARTSNIPKSTWRTKASTCVCQTYNSEASDLFSKAYALWAEKQVPYYDITKENPAPTVQQFIAAIKTHGGDFMQAVWDLAGVQHRYSLNAGMASPYFNMAKQSGYGEQIRATFLEDRYRNKVRGCVKTSPGFIKVANLGNSPEALKKIGSAYDEVMTIIEDTPLMYTLAITNPWEFRARMTKNKARYEDLLKTELTPEKMHLYGNMLRYIQGDADLSKYMNKSFSKVLSSLITQAVDLAPFNRISVSIQTKAAMDMAAEGGARPPNMLDSIWRTKASRWVYQTYNSKESYFFSKAYALWAEKQVPYFEISEENSAPTVQQFIEAIKTHGGDFRLAAMDLAGVQDPYTLDAGMASPYYKIAVHSGYGGQITATFWEDMYTTNVRNSLKTDPGFIKVANLGNSPEALKKIGSAFDEIMTIIEDTPLIYTLATTNPREFRARMKKNKARYEDLLKTELTPEKMHLYGNMLRYIQGDADLSKYMNNSLFMINLRHMNKNVH